MIPTGDPSHCFKCNSSYKITEVAPGFWSCPGICRKQFEAYSVVQQITEGQNGVNGDPVTMNDEAEDNAAAAPHEWAVGEPCRAKSAADGIEYEAEIISIDATEQGAPYATVFYVGYGNEETFWLESLRKSAGSPARKHQIVQAEQSEGTYREEVNEELPAAEGLAQVQEEEPATMDNKTEDNTDATPHEWAVGEPCRAVSAADGIEYEAEIISIETNEQGAPYAKVFYIGYGNEETFWLQSLRKSAGLPARKLQIVQAEQSEGTYPEEVREELPAAEGLAQVQEEESPIQTQEEEAMIQTQADPSEVGLAEVETEVAVIEVAVTEVAVAKTKVAVVKNDDGAMDVADGKNLGGPLVDELKAENEALKKSNQALIEAHSAAAERMKLLEVAAKVGVGEVEAAAIKKLKLSSEKCASLQERLINSAADSRKMLNYIEELQQKLKEAPAGAGQGQPNGNLNGRFPEPFAMIEPSAHRPMMIYAHPVGASGDGHAMTHGDVLNAFANVATCQVWRIHAFGAMCGCYAAVEDDPPAAIPGEVEEQQGAVQERRTPLRKPMQPSFNPAASAFQPRGRE